MTHYYKLSQAEGDRSVSAPPGSLGHDAELRRFSLNADTDASLSLSWPFRDNRLDFDSQGLQAQDATPTLIRSVPSIVKTRTGSVLSRGMILKSDHYPSGRALQMDINLQGAPNFRAPRHGDLNVFGVAQPRLQGLKAILSILGCRPDAKVPSRCIWFSTREEPIGKSRY